jgi:Fe2+ or Zn2+ uptake regulation protein
MPDTSFEKKAEIKEAMRDVILSAGSPVSMTHIHDKVAEEVHGNPSFNTIKSYLNDFHDKGFVESETYANHQTYWKPTDNKKTEFKRFKFNLESPNDTKKG